MSGAVMTNETTHEALDELQTHCQFRLGNRVRHLRLTSHDTGIVINGQCATYYAKQLAQHVVAEECGGKIAANDIEVVSVGISGEWLAGER